MDAARYEETLLWAARALQFAPDDPHFHVVAYDALDTALKHRLRRFHPERKIAPLGDPKPFFFDVGDLLAVEERCLYFTIMGHFHESLGEIDAARTSYEAACRQNFHGNNEQRDFQRFLRKHGRPRRKGPLLPPKNVGQPRRFKLSCPPHEEAPTLWRLADEFELAGELLKARDALHDLYLFDPGDAEVFERARAIERRPQFQAQLKAAFLERRGALRSKSRTDGN